MNEYSGPNYKQLFKPVIDALKNLGGSGTIHEINEQVIEDLNFPDEIIDFPHKNTTKIAYQLGWTRTCLKFLDLVTNSDKGVWVLTQKGQNFDLDNDSILNEYLEFRRKKRQKKKEENKNVPVSEEELKEELKKQELEEELVDVKTEENWRETLRNLILGLNAFDFEKLTQLILRESGFMEVEVTKKTGDGGFDGKGILRLNNLVSIPVIFECKKYSDKKITSEQIRTFRGAMEGRANKGLYITTSYFTRNARQEASREGAVLIDLIDGEKLIDIIKDIGEDLNLIKIETVEKITINPDWFKIFQQSTYKDLTRF